MPSKVSSPGLSPEEAIAWAALPQPLVHQIRLSLPTHWRGDKPREVSVATARGILRAWDEASLPWRSAILALEEGVESFTQWVKIAHAKNKPPRLNRLESRDWTEYQEACRTNISGPLMSGRGEKCGTSLLRIVLESGYLPHYAAWVNTGLFSPDDQSLDFLRKKIGLCESWHQRERRLRVE